MDDTAATLDWQEDGLTLACRGEWIITQLSRLDHAYQAVLEKAGGKVTLDASGLDNLDSAGALLLCDIVQALNHKNCDIRLTGLSEHQQTLMNLVAAEVGKVEGLPTTPKGPGFFCKVGMLTVEKVHQLLSFIHFIGELTVDLLKAVMNPRRMPWRHILHVMDDTGYQALPILALMTFLIGIVLAYELAIQLRAYGANIFIVDVTGVVILREFAPLIAAIILAGRTSTAFAALLGTMKVNEELDALRIMGIPPVERLVIPRIIGLILAFPLLIVWADIFGVFGSMVMAKSELGVGYVAFFERFKAEVGVIQYILGLVKAPFFALIIAGVGCFQGLQVEGSADSVGQQTTKAAVQSIFLIIIADAVFSVIFSWIGI